MNIKKLIGYLLLALLIIGMTTGIICIFHFIGGFTLWFSILFTLVIFTATALLTSLVFLISDLISD
jgi:hypothetical protein